jgi:glutamate racemase
LLEPVIRKVMGKETVLINSAKQVAIEVKKILAQEGLLHKGRKGAHKFFVSDNPEWFGELAERFLGRPPTNVKKVSNV